MRVAKAAAVALVVLFCFVSLSSSLSVAHASGQGNVGVYGTAGFGNQYTCTASCSPIDYSFTAHAVGDYILFVAIATVHSTTAGDCAISSISIQDTNAGATPLAEAYNSGCHLLQLAGTQYYEGLIYMAWEKATSTSVKFKATYTGTTCTNCLWYSGYILDTNATTFNVASSDFFGKSWTATGTAGAESSQLSVGNYPLVVSALSGADTDESETTGLTVLSPSQANSKLAFGSPTTDTPTVTWECLILADCVSPHFFANVALGFSAAPKFGQTSTVYTTLYLVTTETVNYLNSTSTAPFVQVTDAITNWLIFMLMDFVPVALLTIGAYEFLRYAKVDDDRPYIAALLLVLFSMAGFQLLPDYVPIFAAVIGAALLYNSATGGQGTMSPEEG